MNIFCVKTGPWAVIWFKQTRKQTDMGKLFIEVWWILIKILIYLWPVNYFRLVIQSYLQSISAMDLNRGWCSKLRKSFILVIKMWLEFWTLLQIIRYTYWFIYNFLWGNYWEKYQWRYSLFRFLSGSVFLQYWVLHTYVQCLALCIRVVTRNFFFWILKALLL